MGRFHCVPLRNATRIHARRRFDPQTDRAIRKGKSACPDKSLSIDTELPSLNSEPGCIKVVDTFRTVIGGAFRVLTDDVDGQEALKTSLRTLTRVLDGVDWAVIGKGDPEAWLYFYEHFLEAYDNALRKQTGSYYTPPEVVTAMVRLVDEALRDPERFGIAEGLASADVTLADPAMGTGTYLLSRDSWLDQRIDHSLVVKVFDGCMDGLIEVGDAREGLMGQLICLQIVPNDLDVVQFRGIFWQPLDREPVRASGKGRL